MIRCLLCGGEFGAISYAHLKVVHGITLDDYRGMFPHAELMCEGQRREISIGNTGKVRSEETRREISESLRGHVKSGETCRRMSESLIGHEVSEESRRRTSETLIGHEVSEETRRKISVGNANKVISEKQRRGLSEKWKDSEYAWRVAKSVSETMLTYYATHEVSGETRRKLSESQGENWKDPEFAQRMTESWNRKPNESELQLQSILDKHFPGEWKYVGDGKDDKNWFEGRNPDFLNVNHKKQVVEMFGIYWHDPLLFPNRPTEEELIAHYKKCGIDCLVIWEYDVWDEEEVVKRVKDFIKMEVYY